MFRDIKFFTASTLIHFGLLFLVSTSQLAATQIEVELKEQSMGSGGSGDSDMIIVPKEDKSDRACLDSFGGIGLLGFPLVEKVYPGYIAYKSGIRAGDVIHSNEEIRGKVGTEVVVTVTRGEKSWSLT